MSNILSIGPVRSPPGYGRASVINTLVPSRAAATAAATPAGVPPTTNTGTLTVHEGAPPATDGGLLPAGDGGRPPDAGVIPTAKSPVAMPITRRAPSTRAEPTRFVINNTALL